MTKIVVIGGTRLIGSKVVARLTEHGHEAIAASPKSGVNTLTGEGLAEVLSGAQVVVDVSNSPSFEDKAALDFFTTSTGNLLAAEKAAGVGHHVVLSVVGTERLPESGYLRAKLAQEKLRPNCRWATSGTRRSTISRVMAMAKTASLKNRIRSYSTSPTLARTASARKGPPWTESTRRAVAPTPCGAADMRVQGCHSDCHSTTDYSARQ
jgi:uncharacterized protein YbjT (DUF2867 family)